jgi:ABC-type branched-subunit amino acid transport system ATPase component
LALLEAEAISAGYGPADVLRELDLHVDAGEVVALLGPNGAGKSTTLKALSGALPLSGGTLRWDGQPTTAPLHRRARLGLAYVTEERAIFARLTTADNLRVGGADPAVIEELFPELGKRMGLRAGSLSGGEQQMLAVGRALARHPRMLFADELSLGLAPIVVERLLGVIRAQADRGLGVLLVEQHVRQVLDVADRVVILRGGTVQLSGTTAEVKQDLGRVEASYLGQDAASSDPPPQPRSNDD